MGRKREEGGAGDLHKYPQLGLRPPGDLRAAIEELAGEERRALSQMAVILLEEALAARGRWPRQGRKGK